MRVLVFSIYAYTSPHFETELEIMVNHQKQMDEVFVVRCGQMLASCMWNTKHDEATCFLCRSRSTFGLRKIRVPGDHVYNLKIFEHVKQVVLPTFTSVEELMHYKYDGADIGLAVTSSLVSQLNDHGFSVTQYQRRIHRNIRMAIQCYHNALDYIEQLKPDLIYVFNGRFADQRPIIRAAEKLGVAYRCHERGANINMYDIYDNSLPHNRENVAQILQNVKLENNKDKEIAANWFIERRQGVEQSWYSYTINQKNQELPAGFDNSKNNIAIFNSTEAEFFAIDGWQNPLFKDQNDAIRNICLLIKENSATMFYLRVHPNQKNADNKQSRDISTLQGLPNLKIIPADASVDSYYLMERCDKVLTFGSTMGVEATFWGKPSIMVGQAFYTSLACVYVPKNEAELIDLILDSELSPKKKEQALYYGFRQATHGYLFKYFKADGLFSGTFMGTPLEYDGVGKLHKRLKSIFYNRLPGKIFRKILLIFKLDYIISVLGIRKLYYKILTYLSNRKYRIHA